MRLVSLGFLAVISVMSSCRTEVSVLPSATTPGTGGSSCEPLFGTRGEQPPLPPASNQLPDGRGVALAMDSLNLGATGANAWRQLGFNLDNRISGADATDLCQPHPDASPTQVQTDGADGIDNNFGKLILPLILAIDPEFQENLDASIAAGTFTHIFAIDTLGDASLYFPLTTRWYHGVSLGTEPAWDGSDRWPIHSDWLETASDLMSANTTMPCSYMTDDRWVSSNIDAMSFQFPIGANTLRLALLNAVASMALNASHTKADGGRLGAVIETEALVEQLRQLLGATSADLCSGSVLESTLASVRQASDMVIGDQRGSSVACNGISIGLSFSATEVLLGSVALSPGPPADPCQDGSSGEEGRDDG